MSLLNAAELAAELRVHPETVRRMAARGAIPFITVNRRGDRRFDKTAVLAALTCGSSAREVTV